MTVQSTSRDTRSARQITRKAIPLEKAHIHNTAKTASTDFLAADITPSDPPCLFRIMVQLDTEAAFYAYVNNTTEVALLFNGGTDLAAGVLYMFDMLVNEDDEVNFQADENVNVDKFIVQEILWGTQ